MPGRFRTITLFSSLLSLLLLLAACAPGVGTIPRGTPDTGNGTPAVIPSPIQSPVATALAGTTGANFAFVRNNQLWVALNGAKPGQVTSFNYTSTPEVFWRQPAWSPGDHYLAFVLNASPVGVGGGGCPTPDYAANGALYLLNTATKHVTRLALPSSASSLQPNGTPPTDYWQYTFWEDATHLLAWYNGATGTTSSTAGLYRYDVNAQTLTQVIPQSALGAATLFNGQQNMPLLLSMRYSSKQLFYQLVVHPFGRQSQLILYSRSLAQPQAQSKQLVSMGSEAWCATPQAGSFVYPGWDISPDGEQLVAQMIVADSAGEGSGTIQVHNLADSSTTQLFTQLSADALAHDLTLTWGPDSQKVVATAYHMPVQSGPFTATLANPAATQQYDLNLAGQASWKPDSSAFALQNTEIADATTTPDVYVFLTADPHGRMLLTDAYDFVWG